MPSDGVGTGPTPWRAVQVAVWEALSHPSPTSFVADPHDAEVWYMAVAMLMWQLLLLLLASAMLALTPAALASPPDQHWLTGVYDDADYDDVVLAILESVALVELHSPHDSQIDEATVAVVFPTDERVHVAPLRSSNLPRAPPASKPVMTDGLRQFSPGPVSLSRPGKQGWGDM